MATLPSYKKKRNSWLTSSRFWIGRWMPRLAQSPISSASVSGADGLGSGEKAVEYGRCLIDGPYANSTRYSQATLKGGDVDLARNRHYLSLGFETTSKKQELQDRVFSDCY